MGGNNVKPRDPREEIEDSILEMKMTAKQLENGAKRATRDQKKEIDKARAVTPFLFQFVLTFSQALKKGNEEGAKYLLHIITCY